MAYLVKCSLCGRDVSNECNSCPGCGHNVRFEVRKDTLEKQGLCRECGSRNFKTYQEWHKDPYPGTNWKMKKCTECGWSKRIDN